VSTQCFRNSCGAAASSVIAALLALAFCGAYVSSAQAQAVNYYPATGVLQLNNSGSNYAANLGSIIVYVENPAYLPSGGTINVLNGDWGTQVFSTTDANNLTRGDLMDWYYNTSTNDPLPQGVYTLGQLPTGMAALNFGYSYSYTSGPQHTLHTVNDGAGDTSGAVLFGSVLGGPPSGSTVNVVGEIDWTNAAGDGAWGNSSNWSVPNSGIQRVPLSSDTATFANPALAGSITVTGTQSVGSLSFDSSGSYTIGRGTGGALSLSNTATILVDCGSQAIAVPLSLGGSLNVDLLNSSARLTVSGPISGSGPLMLTGSGTLELAGDNTYIGGTTVEGGTLIVDQGLPNGSSLVVGAGGMSAFDPVVSGATDASSVVTGHVASIGSPSSVPEPATIALLGVSAVALTLLRQPMRRTGCSSQS
jgi:autotransporter-associated beta strand protein